MTTAAPVYSLNIYRNLDDFAKGLLDDSPYTLQLHQRRATALHEIFDGAGNNFDVVDWGLTDDNNPHELITMAVIMIAAPVLSRAATPLLIELGKFIGGKIADKAVSDTLTWIVAKFHPKQQAGEIGDYFGKTPSGTAFYVAVPTGARGTLRLTMPDGTESELMFGQAQTPP
jgi:hypothetical protein